MSLEMFLQNVNCSLQIRNQETSERIVHEQNACLINHLKSPNDLNRILNVLTSSLRFYFVFTVEAIFPVNVFWQSVSFIYVWHPSILFRHKGRQTYVGCCGDKAIGSDPRAVLRSITVVAALHFINKPNNLINLMQFRRVGDNKIKCLPFVYQSSSQANTTSGYLGSI